MPLVNEGLSKAEILAKTKHSLGLNNINLEIYPQEIFVVMGLSGSGKSTLIRHLNRLIEPTSGEIVINGKNILTLDKKQLRVFRQQTISMVFQNFGLLPHYTVIQNVAFGLQVQGIKKAERMSKAKRWLKDVGLEGYENQYPSQLSGGQQRIGLARALCTDAEVLLMDEAFSALDPLIRSEMQDQLITLQDQLHKTIVFITHDLDEALRIGDRIAILNDGQLVQVGTPAEILLNPADDYVEKFVRDVNRARALTVDTVMQPASFRISASTVGEALKQMRTSKYHYAYHVDNEGFQGSVSLDQLESVEDALLDEPLSKTFYNTAIKLSPDSVLEEVIPETLDNPYPLPVVDKQGNVKGELSRENIADVLSGQFESNEE